MFIVAIVLLFLLAAYLRLRYQLTPWNLAWRLWRLTPFQQRTLRFLIGKGWIPVVWAGMSKRPTRDEVMDLNDLIYGGWIQNRLSTNGEEIICLNARGRFLGRLLPR